MTTFAKVNIRIRKRREAMGSITIGARISEELDRDLRQLSAATGRSKSWLVAEALKGYIETEKAFIEAVEQGIQAADEGRLVEHETVVTEFERRYRSR
jgi:RHH-type transcriptional regulator, rel operon repressor / antitoxin RelB